jgi:hypothetical protein
MGKTTNAKLQIKGQLWTKYDESQQLAKMGMDFKQYHKGWAWVLNQWFGCGFNHLLGHQEVARLATPKVLRPPQILSLFFFFFFLKKYFFGIFFKKKIKNLIR